MWDNSIQQNINDFLLSPETSEWIKDFDKFNFDWESSEVKEKVQDTIDI